jgi:hypothetical protein
VHREAITPGVAIVYYSVQRGVVVMHDKSGKPTGRRIPAGPREVAYLITRES